MLLNHFNWRIFLSVTIRGFLEEKYSMYLPISNEASLPVIISGITIFFNSKTLLIMSPPNKNGNFFLYINFTIVLNFYTDIQLKKLFSFLLNNFFIIF